MNQTDQCSNVLKLFKISSTVCFNCIMIVFEKHSPNIVTFFEVWNFFKIKKQSKNLLMFTGNCKQLIEIRLNDEIGNNKHTIKLMMIY